MVPTRRQVLLASTGGLTAFAGCSVLSDPQQFLLVAVNNYTDTRRQAWLLVEKGGTEQVRQYLEVPAAEPDGWATVETKIALGELPDGTRIDVTVWTGDGLKATTSMTLTCSSEYAGDGIYAQLDASGNLRLNEWCYDEFPSSEARQGNQSVVAKMPYTRHTSNSWVATNRREIYRIHRLPVSVDAERGLSLGIKFEIQT